MQPPLPNITSDLNLAPTLNSNPNINQTHNSNPNATATSIANSNLNTNPNLNPPSNSTTTTNTNVDINIDLLAVAQQINCQELHTFMDNNSGIQGIIAIYSTKLGPALGGCRFLPYKSNNLAAIDAMLLAKSMALKSAMADLPLGGGKAVLIHPNPANPDLASLANPASYANPYPANPVTEHGNDHPVNQFNRLDALKAFGKFVHTLNGRYITAVDSGTTVADMDIIATETNFVTSTSKFKYTHADPSIATAYGVFQGMLAACKFKWNMDNLTGMHIAVQGVGNVGYNLVKFLYNHYKQQVKISICDPNQDLLRRSAQEFSGINIITDPENIYTVEADVFAPCALGGVLNPQTIEKLKAKIIAGAANNQLADLAHAHHLHELDILYAPDFVINAGGIIYVAGPILKQSESENLAKISNIYNTLSTIFQLHKTHQTNPYSIAYNLALQKLQ